MKVIALGFFDGVHIGHAALLKRAAGLSGDSCALTFDVPPEFFTKGVRQPLIVTPADRETLLKEYVRETFILHFDSSVMHMNWSDFIDDILVGKLRAGHVVAGHDFHFGYKGEGTPERLVSECARLGIGCDIIPKVELDGVTVSSTYIRSLISRGDMENASRFLGRPYFLSGTVEHGRGLGTALGMPTVNLALSEEIQAPMFGVYQTLTLIDGMRIPSITNVGVRPTVEKNGSPTAETTIFDFNGNIYGKQIRVEFLRFIREEQTFEDLNALRTQVQHDVETVRAMHGV